MKKEIFKGVGTALITPFNNGAVDYVSLKVLLDKQIEAGVDAVVILGTTGEPCTLKANEREKIIKTAISQCRGRVKIIVGCGSNNTHNAKAQYVQAQKLGADGALVVTPYYNKCTQDGLIEHYKCIAGGGKLPIIVYNVPSRTGVNIEPKTLKELTKIDNICGVKEASGNILQVLECFRVIQNDIAIYSGEDSLNYIFSCLGGSGYISVLSNVMPRATKRVFKLIQNGEYEKANILQIKLLPLIKSLFIKVNPIPVKVALSRLGLCKNELRLPLTKLQEEDAKIVCRELDNLWAEENDNM